MSTDDTPNAPAPRDRREAVREKAQQVHARQSRARMLSRIALGVGVVAAVAVVGVVVSWAVGAAASRPQLSPATTQLDGFAVTSIPGATTTQPMDQDATPTPSASPSPTASAAGTEASSTTTAAVAIHVYVDYLSPSAREWQLANSTQLSSWLADGAATLTYHPVAMLTAKSNGTKYSLRAANAAACVATYAPESFFTFNNDLLTRQPAVDSDGFSDKDLADIAQANGAGDPKRLRECIESESFSSWVKEATERAVSGIDGTDGLALTGTSMVTVNGQAYVGDPTDPAEFSQFVLTSASGAYNKAKESATPTPEPTPSETPSATPTPSETPAS